MIISDDNALQLLLDLANTQPDKVANMMVEPENAELARNLQNGGGTLGFGYMLDDSGSLVGDQTAAVKEFALLSARVGVRINPEVVRSFNDVFVRKAGGAAEIDEDTFKAIMCETKPFDANPDAQKLLPLMFRTFDANKNGKLSYKEIVLGMSIQVS